MIPSAVSSMCSTADYTFCSCIGNVQQIVEEDSKSKEQCRRDGTHLQNILIKSAAIYYTKVQPTLHPISYIDFKEEVSHRMYHHPSEYSKEINLILIRLEMNAKPQPEINLYNFMYHNIVSPPSQCRLFLMYYLTTCRVHVSKQLASIQFIGL